MSAVDFSFARFTVAQLKAAGVTVVIRYLTGAGKAVSATELAADLEGGVSVVLTFENTATDASDGAAVGAQYARQANAALSALGLPLSTPVYFDADTDYPNPQSAVPYYQGIASVRPASTNGCYGEGALLNLLFSLGLVAYGWESESTSFPGSGTLSPNAALWQKVNGAPLSGTDLDLIEKADFGQLPRPVPPSPNAPPAPIHFQEDSVQTQNVQIEVAGGEGWAPSPVSVAKLIGTPWVAVENPDVVGHYDTVPTTIQASATAGKDSPNGVIIARGLCPDGIYTVVCTFGD